MVALLEGRVAVVTGGTDGIGRATAEAFLAQGASVCVSGRRAEKGELLLEALGAGDRLQFVQADACDQDQAASVIDRCVERFGTVDILVNNVGGGSSQFAMIHELSDSGWLDGIELNLHSAFWSSRRALQVMVAQQWGRIINISSVEGKMTTMATIAPYVVAKHALNGLTKCIAFEYGEMGITCNAICPGAVDTEALRQSGLESSKAAGITYDEFIHGFVKHAATKRLSRVDEIASVAVLLASDAAGNVTGALWNVDGGTASW